VAENQTLSVSVVTPEGAAYEGQAARVVAPAYDGEMAVYPQHAPFVGVLGYGELRITSADGGATAYYYLGGGVVQVADDVVSILAEHVMPAGEVDAGAAEADLQAALASEASGTAEIEARLARMAHARARMRTAARAAERGQLTAKQTLAQPVE
jgi:F-type H+-transporting ATPase subunit epsilon